MWYRVSCQQSSGLRCSRALAQTAWCFLNDSFETEICMQCPPHQLACAAIYLALQVVSGVREFCFFWRGCVKADSENAQPAADVH